MGVVLGVEGRSWRFWWSPSSGQTASSGYVVVNLTIMLMLVICPPIANGAMTYGVGQDLRGLPVRMLETLKILLRRFPPMIGVAICLLPLVPVSFLLALIVGLDLDLLVIRIKRQLAAMWLPRRRMPQLPVATEVEVVPESDGHALTYKGTLRRTGLLIQRDRSQAHWNDE